MVEKSRIVWRATLDCSLFALVHAGQQHIKDLDGGEEL